MNGPDLRIIEFYYQNACSVKKVHCALFPFYAQFNRPSTAAIRAIVSKFRTEFTLLDNVSQHAYPEFELKKIAQLYRPVLMMNINYRFVAVGPLKRDKFCESIKL